MRSHLTRQISGTSQSLSSFGAFFRVPRSVIGHPASALTGPAGLCNPGRQRGLGSNFPSDLTPEHNNIIISLPSGHSATLLLRVGDTGFDFSPFSWPLLPARPTRTGKLQPTVLQCWRSAQPNILTYGDKNKSAWPFFPFIAPGITYTSVYFSFFFSCGTLKSPISPLFSQFVLLLQKVSDMSSFILLPSVDYLDYCPLFPAKPVIHPVPCVSRHTSELHIK